MMTFSLYSFSQGDNGRNMQAAGAQDRLRLNSPNVDPYTAESTSPFFSDKWMKSIIVLVNGKTQVGLRIKLDLFENNMHYLDETGIENISITPVREVVLMDSLTSKEYRFIPSSAIAATGVEPGWYEVLSSGNSSLYKKTIKKLAGPSSHNSEDEVGSLSTSTKFYVLSNSKLFQVKKVKEIPEVLKDKRDELLRYIKSQKLGGKSENDMISLIQYYNTLK